MVVQRGEPVKIWGFAPAESNGGTIHGEFMGETAETTVSDGSWTLVFDKLFPANANLGNDLRVYSNAAEVILKDVLIGDVYMVIGQSNVAYSMNEHWAAIPASDTERCSSGANLDYPIRINYNTQMTANGSFKRGSADKAVDISRRNSWRVASNSNIRTFSAIGYLFGWNYARMTNSQVPIGLIEFDGNGQPLGAFVPNEIAERFKTDSWNASKGYYVTTGVNANWGRFIYNEYMAPFERMPIAGILWYQGESDYADNERNRYADVFTAYVEHMRGLHNTVNRNFPVYFIEFPSMYTKPSTYTGTWAYMETGRIRGAMGNMVMMSENLYQVQSSDVWNDRTYWNSLHPNCKYEQALRAAKIACAVNGEGGIAMSEASGPIIESVTYSDDYKTVTIKYKNVGDGLTTADGGTTVKGYSALANKNTVGATLTGTITGKDTVVVTSVNALHGIAYNVVTTYYYGQEVSLCNSAGIPAGAFMLWRG